MALSSAAVVLTSTSLVFALLTVSFRVRHDARGRRWDDHVRDWEPAILEVLDGTLARDALVARIEAGEPRDFLSFLMTYVRRLRGEEQNTIRDLAQPFLPVLVPILERGTTESRANAVLILARLGMPEYRDEVSAALDDASPLVAMVAAQSLFRPEHEEHFPRVLEHLPRFTRWSRSFLAGLLAGGGPAASPLLRDILGDPDHDPSVRAVAADALRSLNDLDSVPLAARLLTSEPDREIAASCLRILKHLGQAEHVPLVREKSASSDAVVRATAVSALGAIGAEEEVPILRDRLDDPSFWVTLEAARGLLALGNRTAVEGLALAAGPSAVLARQVLAE